MTVFSQWLKKQLPTKKSINQNASMSVFHNYLRHPDVWYLNYSSVARGAAIGLFIAFIPLPLQMLMAALLAILFRANLPVAVAMTWITNPFTFIPFNYFIYWVGKEILGEPVADIILPIPSNVSFFSPSLVMQISKFSKAYFVGLPVVAITVAVLGYFIVKITWYIILLLPKKTKN